MTFSTRTRRDSRVPIGWIGISEDYKVDVEKYYNMSFRTELKVRECNKGTLRDFYIYLYNIMRNVRERGRLIIILVGKLLKRISIQDVLRSNIYKTTRRVPDPRRLWLLYYIYHKTNANGINSLYMYSIYIL